MSMRITAVTIGVSLMLSGCGEGKADGGASKPSASASPSTSAPSRNEVECVNIKRAYEAFNDFDRPMTAEAFKAMTDFHIKMEMEDTEDFLKAVEGYEDQPSKGLAVAIAEYNMELSFANAEATITGESMESDTAAKLPGVAAGIDSAMTEFQNTTC